MKRILAIPAVISLGLAACETMNRPVTSGSFDPLQAPGTEQTGIVANGTTFSAGQFVRAVTRGNGARGDDVTANVSLIREIPRTLKGAPELLEVRGEIYMELGELDKAAAQAKRALELGYPRQELRAELQRRGITQLVFMGVTTEVCVQTSMREANDRGYDCLLLEDCTESYIPGFKQATLDMVTAQGGIVGWVCPSPVLLAELAAPPRAALAR